MPQLRGREQKVLFEILVEHLDLSQLGRALEYHGLPSLDELTGDGNLRDKMSEVIKKLSQRYLIVDLVEAALQELDNHCPPMQAWLAEHRPKLLQRRDRPLPVKWAFDWAAMLEGPRAVLAGSLGALLLGFVGWSVWPPQAGPIICQIHDSATNARILKPFLLRLGGTTYESVDSQCRPPFSGAGLENVEVSCAGYLERKPDQVEAEGQLRRLFITRDPEYFLGSIEPDYASLPFPSDDVIKSRIARNALQPSEVTFLVKNETDVTVDVLLYYLPPSDHPDARNPFLPKVLAMPPVAPRAWSQPFEKFSFAAGFFVIFASTSGQRARPVTSDAIYRAKFAVMDLTQAKANEDPRGKMEYFSSDPRY